MSKKTENILGFIFLILVLVWGRFYLNGTALFFRLIIGMSLGYALTRSFFGFAGSVNRMCHTGSTKLMRALMLMFLASSILTAGILLMVDATTYNLWVNPINLGVVLGGLLFGIGMAFSFCCASGVITDLVTGLPRAFVTLFFFGMGVFLGFPVQSGQTWVTTTLFSTETFPNGVFLPDFFKNDGMNGYLGAVLLTALFCGIVVVIFKMIEDRYKAQGRYIGCESEINQDKVYEENDEPFKLFSERTYDKLFVRPWTLGFGALVISGLFALLMNVTKAGWGASTPYGFWFGRMLTKFGVPVESIAEFTTKPAKVFTMPFFDHPINVQNVGIFLGTIIALLLIGNLKATFKEGLSIKGREVFLYAFGGLCMGFGTRLSNGCNVGALYTPIANFSLSGWIFFIFLVLGGVIGYKLNKLAVK